MDQDVLVLAMFNLQVFCYFLLFSCQLSTNWLAILYVYKLQMEMLKRVKMSLCLVNSALCHEDICGTCRYNGKK
jgi:hypothetical protein